MKSARLVSAFLTIILCAGIFLVQTRPVLSSSGQWKITSVKVCRSRGGALVPTIHAVGSFPVYSFFIPRPVWTVNGSVVETQPVYAQGRLVEFQLIGGTEHLKPGEKNTIKFSLPDHTGTKIFFFQDNRIPAGECFEFF